MLNTLPLQTLMRTSQNLRTLYQIRMNSFLRMSPKILVFAENADYKIETIANTKDLLASLKLRNHIEKSFSDIRLSEPRLSISDDLDSKADHIIFRNKKTNSIVGGFRLLSSAFSKEFASEKKFNLSRLKMKSSRILELSRLFLLPEHRHCEIISLTVQFLSHYCLNSSAELIISEQTLSSTSFRSAALMHHYFLSTLKLEFQDFATCRPDCEVPNFHHWERHFKSGLSNAEKQEVQAMLSTIFAESMRLGTKICGLPSFDKATNRIDFLTILHKEDLNRALWKKSRH